MTRTPYFFPGGFRLVGPGYFSRLPVLSLDFDGTLAEIVPTPREADRPGEIRSTFLGDISGVHRFLGLFLKEERNQGGLYGNNHGE